MALADDALDAGTRGAVPAVLHPDLGDVITLAQREVTRVLTPPSARGFPAPVPDRPGAGRTSSPPRDQTRRRADVLGSVTELGAAGPACTRSGATGTGGSPGSPGRADAAVGPTSDTPSGTGLAR